MLLTELFNKVPEHEVTKNTSDALEAEADIGERKMHFVANKKQETWDIEFFSYDTFGDKAYFTTKEGNEFEVFSFVLKMIKQLIDERKPEQMVFAAKQADGRSKLYRKMIERFTKSGSLKDYEFILKAGSKSDLMYLNRK